MSLARINLFWLVIFTLTLPLAVVASTHLARKSFEKVKLRGQTVTVKGYAERPIVSDRAEWAGYLEVRDPDRTAAYVALAKHRDRLLAYLDQMGFPADQVELGRVSITEVYTKTEEGKSTNTIEYFKIGQSCSIASQQVHAVARVAREAGGLIGEGIGLEPGSPRYLYTKLDQMKLRMLEEATANARERAALLVAGGGDRLGPLRSASQGVFQITPAFSTEVSSYGENDTSSLDKVIKAVVTVEYAIGG